MANFLIGLLLDDFAICNFKSARSAPTLLTPHSSLKKVVNYVIITAFKRYKGS